MKIFTLGTSHGTATPTRFNSSTLYETEGVFYLIDVGAPCEALMTRQGLPKKDLRAAFVTHMHDDHAGGLTSLLKEVKKRNEGRSLPFTLYLPEENAVEALKGWLTALHEDSALSIEYRTVSDGVIHEDERLRVSAIRTAHLKAADGTPVSFSFLLEFLKEGKSVLHTGDLSHSFTDFPRIAKERHLDLCVLEATHYCPEAAHDLLMAARLDRLILTHIGNRWHDGLPGGEGEAALIATTKEYPYPTEIAHDGDVFIL